MSIPYLDAGRIDQKRRTREALIAAARELVAEGHTPTVEMAAEASSISRTTAYRYFPNQRALLAAAHPEIQTTSLLGEDPPRDTEQRLAQVMERFTQMIVETESQQRAMLRFSLEDDGEEHHGLLRQGRAIGWIEEAFEPLRGAWSDAEIRRLTMAIRAATGIEARVWLQDIGGLTQDEASELLCWIAQAIFRGARRHRPPT